MSDKHMVFTVCDGYVKFQANYSRHGAVNLSGSEPLAVYGQNTDELLIELSHSDIIDHLISVFEPTSSEIIQDSC